MAINDTGAIFKSFVFDGQDSRDYGAYITGSGVFNAPEREVEMVAIPGRNGALALDKGRFSNIEVAYPCGLFGTTEADFAQAASDLRNMLASRVGYCRLTDDYNAGEYRMAVYKSGLEMDLVNLKSGECSIVFECKPQRFLTSGEVDALEQDSGGDFFVDNPTLFPSAPLLEVEGYGDINLGAETVTLDNVTIGDVQMANAIHRNITGNGNAKRISTPLDNSDSLSSGDTIAASGGSLAVRITMGANVSSITGVSVSNGAETHSKISRLAEFIISFDPFTFTAGSPLGSNTINLSATVADSNGTTETVSVTTTVTYNGTDLIEYVITGLKGSPQYLAELNTPVISAVSTKSALGTPTYIDLDIGEAYFLGGDGTPVSANSAVTLPAKLPTLAPGNTEITFDNTITDLKIIPRWWKV